MKNFLTGTVYLAFLCVAFIGSAGAEDKAEDIFAKDIVATSEIKAVTVYNNRAKITRVAEIEIPAGSHTVVFKDLPSILLPDSVRAAGMAKVAVKFGAVATKEIISTQPSPARAREQYDKMQALQDQRLYIEAEKSAIEARKSFLSALGQQAALRANENLAPMDTKPDQWSAAAQAVYSGMSDAMKASVEQDIKLRELDEKIQDAQRDYNQSQNGKPGTYAVLLPLEAETATKLAIELTYQVPEATWKPLYDARVNTDGKSDLKLAQYGAVRQQTGEDWSGVALTLSTAQPQRGSSLPDLLPMWVNAYETKESRYGTTSETVGAQVNDPEYIKKQQDANKRAAEVAMATGGSNIPVPIAPSGDPLAEWRGKTEAKRVKMEQEAPPQQAQFVPAEISTGGFVSEYKIPGPSNVPSDGTETKLLVGNFDVESTLQVHIKPQLSKEAYLVVHSKLKGDSPILPGQVSLFRDEAYVGQSHLPLLRPDEEYDLYFGVDDQVSVKRKVLKDERKQTGVIAKDNILERNYVTELQNLHNVPIDIIVKETTPATQNEKIKVDIDKDITTPGYVADADNIKGLLNWQFKMDPKEKKDLKLDWTVSWPSDFTVNGL